MDIYKLIKREVDSHLKITGSDYISRNDLGLILSLVELKAGFAKMESKTIQTSIRLKDLENAIDNINQNGILINKNNNTDGMFLGLTIKS